MTFLIHRLMLLELLIMGMKGFEPICQPPTASSTLRAGFCSFRAMVRSYSPARGIRICFLIFNFFFKAVSKLEDIYVLYAFRINSELIPVACLKSRCTSCFVFSFARSIRVGKPKFLTQKGSSVCFSLLPWTDFEH